MFNSTYVRGGDNHTNIDINSVSGTLVKNYRKSFFFKCEENSIEAERLFSPINSRINVNYNTEGAVKGEEHRGNGIYTIYYKKTVVLQTMILSNGILLNEVMWQDDFDKMFACGVPKKDEE